jgi:putative glycosyltransferase (TIGR04372 family)
VASRLHFPDGQVQYFCEGMGAIQEQWEAEGRGPLLALSDADREYAPKLLRQLGIPPGAWLVTLHARSPGFHWEKGNPHQAHRNTDVATYFPAMQEVVRRGGWVVRLGDKSMPKLPGMPRVVDYAHSPAKSERADVILCALSKFFVGCTSGLCHLPYAFGTPVLLTNWCSNQLPTFGGQDRFLPKRLRERETGRELTFAEMLEPANRIAAYSGTRLITRGFEWIDNTDDEILGAVKEMLDPAAPPNQWVRAYDRMARANGQVGFSRMANAFAEKHAGLIADGGDDAVPRKGVA